MTPLSKRLIIALAISGALNLLCAGLFVGAAIHRSRAHDPHGRVESDRRAGRGADGPRAGRHEGAERPGKREDRPGRGEGKRGPGPFAGLFAGHREEMLARRQATADARKAVRTSLEREPFDAAALEQSLAALRAQTATTQELIHKQLLDAARSGDGAARQKLAEGFDHMGF